MMFIIKLIRIFHILYHISIHSIHAKMSRIAQSIQKQQLYRVEQRMNCVYVVIPHYSFRYMFRLLLFADRGLCRPYMFIRV